MEGEISRTSREEREEKEGQQEERHYCSQFVEEVPPRLEVPEI